MDSSSKHKANEEISALNDISEKNELTIFRIFHPKTTEHSQGWIMFWGTKLVSMNLRRLKSYQEFSNYRDKKLETNYKKFGKPQICGD